MAHDVRLLRRETVAERTLAFYFERPSGFEYEAGQNASFTLIDPPETDGFGPSRTFTLASAPEDRELMIAVRMRDTAFKRILGAAPLGTLVRLAGPAGLMVLEPSPAKPIVFLAGGIGITPFLSMARHAARKRLPHSIQLFYSNRRPEDAPFLDELRSLERENPNFRMVATMTQPEKSALGWQGRTGPICPEMLASCLPDAKAPLYYFAGPPNMTISMQFMLGELGIPEADMRSEEFYGY